MANFATLIMTLKVIFFYTFLFSFYRIQLKYLQQLTHLPYLVHDGFDDLVADFKLQIPILSENTQTEVSILSQQPYGFNYTRTKNDLEKVGLTGAPLKAKDRPIRGHINRFFKYLKHGSIIIEPF